MKKLLTFFAVLLGTTSLLAADFIVDGIAYKITDAKQYTIEVVSGGTYSGTITIPSFVTYGNTSYNVTSIGECAFWECTELTRLVIPDNITMIGSQAFYKCENLKSIELPNKLQCINNLTFERCICLTNVTIPESVTHIAYRAFYKCYNLGSITIPSNVKQLDNFCFEECHLSGVKFMGLTPPQVGVYWDYHAWVGYNTCNFVPCGRVEAYQTNGIYGTSHGSFPDQIAVNSSDPLLGSVSMSEPDCYTAETQITATANLGYRFSQWSDGIADNPRIVKIVCDTSFVAEFVNDGGSCGDNLSWSYVDGMLFISGNGEMYNYQLNSVPWIKYRDSITTIVLNQGVTSVGNYAFYGCSNKELKTLVLPNSIERIGHYAFAECSWLKDVTFGTNIEEIGNYAFYNDQRLIYITCLANEPPLLGTLPFINYSAYLKVPCVASDEYRVSLGWMSFYNRSCISADEVDVTEIQSEPSNTWVIISWPAVNGSDNYIIEVLQGKAVVCFLVFNAKGQLLSITYNQAPSRSIANESAATETATGWAYTINSLNQGTTYTYSVVAKDKQGFVIDTKKGTFTTTGVTALKETSFPSGEDRGEACKIINDGQLYILRDNKTFNAQGGEVR